MKTHSETAQELTVDEHSFAVEFATHGNATRAYKAVFGVSPGRSPAAIRLAASDLALKTRGRVAELRNAAAQALSVSVAELALAAHETASASMSDLAVVETYGCRSCWSSNGQPRWRDANELAQAIDAHRASLTTPKPTPVPSLGGGFGYSSRQTVDPDCEGCRGHGVALLRVLPTSEWTEGAKQLFEGVQTDDEGRITKVLIADRSKWSHQRNQLIGAYAPAKTESKFLNVNYNLNAPTTPQPPMSVDEAMAKLRELGVLAAPPVDVTTPDASIVSEQ